MSWNGNSTVIREAQNQITIVEGEVRDIPLTLLLSNKDYKPFDITGNTEIVARFIDQNSSYFEVTKTGGAITEINAAAGQIEIRLESADTLQLAKGDRQSFEVHVTLPGAIVRIAQIIGRLNVKPRISC